MAYRRVLIRLEVPGQQLTAANPIRTGLAVNTPQFRAEIAEDLFISNSTVKTHIAKLMTKLDARNRVEIVIWAYETGRVDRT
jgi:DNA-binding NarL/FixJ family response regulator